MLIDHRDIDPREEQATAVQMLRLIKAFEKVSDPALREALLVLVEAAGRRRDVRH